MASVHSALFHIKKQGSLYHPMNYISSYIITNECRTDTDLMEYIFLSTFFFF